MAKRTTRKPAKPAPSKALVRAKTPHRTTIRTVLPNTDWQNRPDPQGRTISDDGYNLGALGLVEIKLTSAEETVLGEPVNPADVKWRARKKNGPLDTPYLPHPVYTKWFNRAFGRLGWALVPVGKPSMDVAKKCVVTPYVLHVHGAPVAFAMGEQEYFESNDNQTFGDALESTVASALRRCAKRMGVGLEMWDKDAMQAMKRPAQQAQQGERPIPPAGLRATHADEGEKITLAQRQRLAMIVNTSARSDAEVEQWLRRYYGLTNQKPTRDILRRDYDAICLAIGAPGPLPERG